MGQGGQDPDGWYARQDLGSNVNPLLSRLEYQQHTVADGGKVQLSDTAAPNGLAVVMDFNNTGVFTLSGSSGGARLLYDSGENREMVATATEDVGSISGGDTATFTVSVTGATTGNPVAVSPPSGIDVDLTVTGYVSATDTVTVVVSNPTSGAIDPASGDYTAKVFDTTTLYSTTEDNDGTTNVYYDVGNSRFELNNETDAETTYDIVFLRAP